MSFPSIDSPYSSSNSASSSHLAVSNRKPGLRLQNTRRLTIFVHGMPRISESETHGSGALQPWVPRRETLLESLVSSRTTADIVEGSLSKLTS